MSYLRVIPRDLFNEVNLLKCIAQLYLASERLPQGKLQVEMIGNPASHFMIEQDPSDGSLWVVNIQVRLDGDPVMITRPLNARSPYPIYATYMDQVELVFDDQGTIRPDFLKLVSDTKETADV